MASKQIREEDVALDEVCQICKKVRMVDKGVRKGAGVRASCNVCESETGLDPAAEAEAMAWLAAHDRDFA